LRYRRAPRGVPYYRGPASVVGSVDGSIPLS
jgi:hypothetical protein